MVEVEAKGFCILCRTPREMGCAQPLTTKKGQRAYRGYCPTCGTQMFVIAAPGAPEAPAYVMAMKGGRPYKRFARPARGASDSQAAR